MERPQYYPVFLDLRGKRVVVVGGGAVATGKVRGLLPCGPDPLVVVAPRASAYIQEQAAAGRLDWRARPFSADDLDGAALAFGATDDRALNAAVAAAARQRGVPVLAVDDVPNCDLIAPAVVKRGDLVIAISTNGRSPALARWLRERLEAALPEHWGELLDVVATARVRLRAAGRRVSPERWQAALDGELERLVQTGDRAAALQLLLARLGPAGAA
jgi:siroheme synthase-like protein